MTTQIVGYIVGLGGLWCFQDGMASIMFYNHNEKWLWNHFVRLLRMLWGLVLIYLGVILIRQ